MKIAISGKGGVGKTSFTAWLAEFLACQGKKVWLVDADTALSLGQACGLDKKDIPQALIKNQALIEEKINPTANGFMVLNPNVQDLPQFLSVSLPQKWSAALGKIYGEKRLLVMGGISEADAGCACQSNALLKAMLAHLILGNDDWVLVDMEAGVEHLGRGTVRHVDHLFVVSEPSMRSLQTAVEVSKMAKSLSLEQQSLILNKAEDGLLQTMPNWEELPLKRIALPFLPSLVEQQWHSPCVLNLSQQDKEQIQNAFSKMLIVEK